MPFNSSGIYSVLIDFATEAASPPIDIDDLDAQMVDIGTALTNCILRDGTGVPTADTPWADFAITGLSKISASAGFQLWANASQRLAVSSVLGTATQLYDPYNAINALKNIATQDTGSFTGTLVGCTTSPTATFTWSRAGGLATLVNASGTLQGTSNSTGLSITGLPAAIQPARNHRIACCVIDAGVTVPGYALFSAGSGTITFAAASAAAYAAGTASILTTGFTNTGTKGTVSSISLTWHLD